MDLPKGPNCGKYLSMRGIFLVKPYKTLQEQLQILHKRQLKLTDYQNNKLYLLTNNYYSIINGYSKYFWISTNKYILGTEFDDISMLYFIDRELKFTFLKAILEAEKHLRSLVAYTLCEELSKSEHPTDYLKKSFYSYSPEKINESKEIDYLIRQIRKLLYKNKNKKANNPIKNHIEKHDGVPFWVMVEYLTFGELKIIIKYLPSIQNKIAKRLCSFISSKMTLSAMFTQAELLSFIENIFETRNVCAHDSRLLDYKCRKNVLYYPPLHDKYSILKIAPKNSVYNTFLILQCFLSDTQYSIFHNTVLKRLKYLDKSLASKSYLISTNKILGTLGFPDNWHKTEKPIKQ